MAAVLCTGSAAAPWLGTAQTLLSKQKPTAIPFRYSANVVNAAHFLDYNFSRLQEYSRRLTTEQQMPDSPSPPESVRPRRFRIGLSYASERRELVVKPVAELLAGADTIGREAVLYDGFLGAEFDRFRLDGYLAELYRDECELIVVFLCPEYVKKEWCQLEWAYIKRLVGTPEDRRIMLLSVGSFGEPSVRRSGSGLATTLRTSTAGSRPHRPADPGSAPAYVEELDG